MTTPINVIYEPQLNYIFVRIVDNMPHWACGKIACDCDEQTMVAMELENDCP